MPQHLEGFQELTKHKEADSKGHLMEITSRQLGLGKILFGQRMNYNERFQNISLSVRILCNRIYEIYRLGK